MQGLPAFEFSFKHRGQSSHCFKDICKQVSHAPSAASCPEAALLGDIADEFAFSALDNWNLFRLSSLTKNGFPANSTGWPA